MKLFLSLLLLIGISVGILYYFGTRNTTHKNSFNSQVIWVKYFKSVDQNAADTEAFVIRVRKDTTITINDSVNKRYYTKFIRDTEYYTPYDTLYKCDTCAIKSKLIKLFVYIPKSWVIYDYNKNGNIVINGTSIPLK